MMRLPWRWSQIVLTAFLLLLAGIAWVACAPLQVGGLASYVIISGVSMEPHFKHGDLVIVHRVTDYRVGDIAAYRNADLNGNVFHRIVGVDLDRFVFQGDNNTWLDSYHPTREELIGRLWVHLPKAGKAITWVRVPLNMAFTVALIGGVFMAGSLLDKPERRGRKKARTRSGGTPGGAVEGPVLALGLLFLASLALGIYAFSHPAWRQADPLPYEHRGTFTYSAEATPGVYDGTMIQTGEPVFPALTCTLRLRFAYEFSSDQPHDLGGTYRLSARVGEEQSGWQRTFPLAAEAEFSGSTFTSEAALDLCQVEAMVTAMEQATGYYASVYQLAILPTVDVQGVLGGEEFRDAFETSLEMRFDELHFFLGNRLDADPLHPSRAGLLPSSASEHNRLSLLGLEPRVLTLRLIALVGLGLSALGVLALVLLLSNAARQDPQAFIRMKYGSMLVSASGRQVLAGDRLLDVDSLDDLARIAERNNLTIDHDSKGRLPAYYVTWEGRTYRYELKTDGGARPGKRSGKRPAAGKEPG